MIILQVGNQFPSCFESFCDIMAPVDQKQQKHRFHRSFSDISYHQVHYIILSKLLTFVQG